MIMIAESRAILPHLNKTTESWFYSLGPKPLNSPLSVLFRIEPHVSYTLRRHFDCMRLMLFIEDLLPTPQLQRGIPTRVFVSGADTVMPSHEMCAYAAKANASNKGTNEQYLRVEVFRGAESYEHGVWCHDSPMNEQMYDAILEVSLCGKES